MVCGSPRDHCVEVWLDRLHLLSLHVAEHHLVRRDRVLEEVVADGSAELVVVHEVLEEHGVDGVGQIPTPHTHTPHSLQQHLDHGPRLQVAQRYRARSDAHMTVASLLLRTGKEHLHLHVSHSLRADRFRGRLRRGWDGRRVHPGTAVGKRRLRGALSEDLLLEREDGVQQRCVVVPLAADDDAEVLGTVEVLVEATDLAHLEGTEIRNVASGVGGVAVKVHTGQGVQDM